MPHRIARRLGLALITAAGFLAASACGTRPEETAKPPSPSGPTTSGPSMPAPSPASVKNEIPPEALEKVMEAHFQGLGYMEQYEYARAIESLRTVHELAPGWIPGSINLAIALLNKSGEEQAAKKQPGDQPVAKEQPKDQGDANVPAHFTEALELLAGVLDREPDNLHAHYCSGIILEQIGRLTEANRHFQRVVERDPRDAASWCKLAATISDGENPALADPRIQAKKQIEPLQKALEYDPYLVQVLYRLQQAYRLAREPAKAKEVMVRWQSLMPDKPTAAPGTGNLLEKWASMRPPSIRSVVRLPRPRRHLRRDSRQRLLWR
jgi:tetratricopeptide (TPR) repeat protein